jgi:siroheme synthase (precorrin-2 oxidase/ferrochelatase)
MQPIVLTKKQKVLIIGAGTASIIKLKVLSRYNYDITILSDKFDQNLDNFLFTKIKKDFYTLDISFFSPFDLIYIGIDLKQNTIIKQLLDTKLVNILSDPKLGNFIHPCSRVDNDIQVSVNNINSSNPKKACQLAEKFLQYKKEIWKKS